MATTRRTMFFLLGMLGLYAVDQAYRFSVQNKRDTQLFQEGYRQLCSSEGELELLAVSADIEIFNAISLEYGSGGCTVDSCSIDTKKSSNSGSNGSSSSSSSSSSNNNNDYNSLAAHQYLIIVRHNSEGMASSIEMRLPDEQRPISHFTTDQGILITENCKANLVQKITKAYERAQGEMVPLQ